MESSNWYKVDNVAKVFLATHSDRDTRSLRVSCTLTEDVEPELLQEALNKTIKTRPLFQVRIRRGFFWHYIEHTDKKPSVREEYTRPCPVLYGKRHNGVLHYSVTYYHKRINFEIFHALTDGSGALEFLNILVLNYLKLKYPETIKGVDMGKDGSEYEREEDSFERFRGSKGKMLKAALKKSYHVHGRKLPYNQLQFFEVTMPSKDVISRAKSMNTGVSGLIGAALMMAFYKDMPLLKRKLPVTISMPVNLRNYYPSETSRNFFNSINISHTFTGEESIEELAKEFETNMKKSLEPDEIRKGMNHYQQFEQLFLVRMVPLVFKQPVVKIISKISARKISAVISNLGIMKIPSEMGEHINNYTALCSHSELFITILSYGDKMTFGITSGYRNTSVIKNFIREFSRNGIEVTVNGTEVVR